MTDRVSGAPGQYQAVIAEQELENMQSGEAFTITLTRDDQPITEGTPYNKASVLPDSLAQKLCPDMQDPTPANALSAISSLLDKGLVGRGMLPSGTNLNNFFESGIYTVSSGATYYNFPGDCPPGTSAAYVINMCPLGNSARVALQLVVSFNGAVRRIRSVFYETVYDWQQL